MRLGLLIHCQVCVLRLSCSWKLMYLNKIIRQRCDFRHWRYFVETAGQHGQDAR